MLFDTHLHTKFSADSDMLLTDAIQSAEKQNIGLVVTEHLDFDYPGEDLFEFDPIKYMNEYLPYRSDKLYLGIEVGMQEHTLIPSKNFIEKAPFDQIICSIHLLDVEDLYYKSCYKQDKQTTYINYLSAMAKLIAQHDFANILGHIDYICRYAPYSPADITLDEFGEAVDIVWKTVLDKGIVPELNTRRFDNINNIRLLLKLYERYAALGGKYVSLGSDAHTKENVGFKIHEAADFMEQYNLKPVYFVNRQMQLCKS